MVIEHGGEFHAYLDRKSLVYVSPPQSQRYPDIPCRTHIITSSLTPAKVVEFQRMKISRPEWLVESVKAEKLLPWQNYVFRPEDRALPSINKAPAQQSLFNSKTTAINNPVTKETDAFPSYAAHKSNPNAARAVENPEWRIAHTSAAPDFIGGYYKNSRLHYLSTWKTELRKLVQEAQERSEEAPSGSSKDYIQGLTLTTPSFRNNSGTRGMGSAMESPSRKSKEKGHNHEYDQVVMHCDFDAFFVSAGLLDRKHLRGKPVVVCHSQGDQGGASSTSEIASASYEARKFGIKNGMRYFDSPLRYALTSLCLC
jgi:DNA repair protein REV1